MPWFWRPDSTLGWLYPMSLFLKEEHMKLSVWVSKPWVSQKYQENKIYHRIFHSIEYFIFYKILSTFFVPSGTNRCSFLDSYLATEKSLGVFSWKFSSRIIVKKGIFIFCRAGVLQKNLRNTCNLDPKWCFYMLMWTTQESTEETKSTELCFPWNQWCLQWSHAGLLNQCQELLLPAVVCPHNWHFLRFPLLLALLSIGLPIRKSRLFCSRRSLRISVGPIFCIYLRL